MCNLVFGRAFFGYAVARLRLLVTKPNSGSAGEDQRGQRRPNNGTAGKDQREAKRLIIVNTVYIFDDARF